MPDELKEWSTSKVINNLGGLGDDLYRKLYYLNLLRINSWWEHLTIDEMSTICDSFVK